MSAPLGSLVVGIVACGLVAAQIVFPGQALFHTWQYALALALVAWLLVSAAAREPRGFITLAMLGAMIVVADGFASGLLGPDTETVVRAPGTIAPLPELGVAAFFAGGDAQTIESGRATITLRRRNGGDIVVPQNSRRFLGASLLIAQSAPAAYIDATDAAGNHLTVTQPTGGSFLSPVLLFRQQQTIAGSTHPVDGFSLPGANRTVKCVYFSPSDVAQLHVPVPEAAAGRPAILYDVFDTASNRSAGIAVSLGGEMTAIGGVHLRATLGRYPRLIVASAPQPLALILGFLLFVVGGLGALLQADHRAVNAETKGHEEEHGDREHRVRPRSQES